MRRKVTTYVHTNISNKEDIKAAKESYKKCKEKMVFTKAIITFLSLTVTLNSFLFNYTHYLHIMECAMMSYANIFTANHERLYISPYIKDMTLLNLK